MKKIIFIVTLLIFAATGFSQKQHSRKTEKIKIALDKYHDNIDDRMKGPKGEAVYIGPNGGRYYVKNGKKIYVEYKGNKKK